MLRLLLSLRLTVVCLALLGLLVFWGTLYQVEYGLYAAQQRFFSSWFFTVLGFVPVPGGQLVMTVLFFNLLAAMLVRFRYGLRQSGLILIHLGLLVLLGGGFVVHHHAEESFLTLFEGEGSNVSSSYREWELALWPQGPERRRVTAVDLSRLEEGTSVQLEHPPVRLELAAYFPNAEAYRSKARPASGVARLEPLPRNHDPNEDVPGARVRIGDTGEEVLLFGGALEAHAFSVDDQPWRMQLRRKRSALPIPISLVDFRREMHPNSEIPKSYSSVVVLDTPVGKRRAHIKMNEPLRYQGYTLYQQSFQEFPDGRQASTFAVVRNYGRLLPYVASILTFLGLLVHFSIEITARRKLSYA